MTAVQSAEPIRQAPKGYTYKSVIGSEHLSYVGHRPSEVRGTAL
jgi:hypothetical protein